MKFLKSGSVGVFTLLISSFVQNFREIDAVVPQINSAIRGGETTVRIDNYVSANNLMYLVTYKRTHKRTLTRISKYSVYHNNRM